MTTRIRTFKELGYYLNEHVSNYLVQNYPEMSCVGAELSQCRDVQSQIVESRNPGILAKVSLLRFLN